MTEHQNGHTAPTNRTTLIVDARVEHQLALRAALRDAGLFPTILSAESAPLAMDILNADSANLALVFLSVAMGRETTVEVLNALAPKEISVVFLAEPNWPDIAETSKNFPVLIRPYTADKIEKLMASPDI